ncbi:MAG: hypothetical protein H6736_21070 [Alphaproteobacteria bacterium]|nr:hypothetical protein [Alphaproteobacteria bacterium]MCB9694310.1 hypothetical protein [Alphaproteobacteria bacterium]
MLALALALTASAQVTDGVAVTVVVQDKDGNPIPSAQVRHPDEPQKHRVNVEDGSWTGDAVYLSSGEELVFQKSMSVPLEISAPGFENKTITLVVNKKPKKNRIEVVLDALAIDLDEKQPGDDGGPSIGFKHDNPRD